MLFRVIGDCRFTPSLKYSINIFMVGVYWNKDYTPTLRFHDIVGVRSKPFSTHFSNDSFERRNEIAYWSLLTVFSPDRATRCGYMMSCGFPLYALLLKENGTKVRHSYIVYWDEVTKSKYTWDMEIIFVLLFSHCFLSL